MAAGQLARELGVPKRILVASLAHEGLCERGGAPTVKAVNWGYARLTGLTDATAGTQVARWHTRRCMRLVEQEPPRGREWDLLLMAEEVDDVLDDAPGWRLPATSRASTGCSPPSTTPSAARCGPGCTPRSPRWWRCTAAFEQNPPVQRRRDESVGVSPNPG